MVTSVMNTVMPTYMDLAALSWLDMYNGIDPLVTSIAVKQIATTIYRMPVAAAAKRRAHRSVCAALLLR